jgi:hypothetical protein
MTHIIQKISLVEFCFSVQSFLDEWEYFSPDEEPTQQDYDDWVKTLTYDTLKDPDYSPEFNLIEDNSLTLTEDYELP